MCLSASENQVLDGIPVLNIHPCNRWHSKPFLFFGASRQKKRNTRLPVGRTRSFFSFSLFFPFFPLIPSIHPSIHRLPENARPFSLSSSPGCSPCENHVIILNLRGSTLTMGLSAPPPRLQFHNCSTSFVETLSGMEKRREGEKPICHGKGLGLTQLRTQSTDKHVSQTEHWMTSWKGRRRKDRGRGKGEKEKMK